MGYIRRFLLESYMIRNGVTYADLNKHYGFNVEALVKFELEVSYEFASDLSKLLLKGKDDNNTHDTMTELYTAKALNSVGYEMLEHVYKLEEMIGMDNLHSVQNAVQAVEKFNATV